MGRYGVIEKVHKLPIYFLLVVVGGLKSFKNFQTVDLLGVIGLSFLKERFF